ncbi:PBP1A family penicillin-binding protein [Tetragenococcus muriaticus]|uniref:Multimodular transpeptidase-transglycosylase n=1 Tax=Tetragenococcus muriaticus 3MR10-3 TaxID=1302648 RepID=A0A091CEJ2_9ENTE|nr:PBP1A family penicillin-binding protein [Tetragenococcus muriaticus]KFN93043.1 multimodular transpeptidase-transglycosylase [Tetragenococcus muriaticus 3MR10-3]GMA48315.1 penicillin-binding protein 2A [Tetragenococcus muriaticus]
MDFQRFFGAVKKYLSSFWAWLKPYLVQFHHWRKRIWKKYHVNKILLLIGLIVILVMSIYLFYTAKTTKVQELKAGLQEETVIYDKDNNEAGSVSSQKGTYVGVEDMSPYVVDAVVSTEDRDFYQHHGFDIKGIARAGLRMIVRRNTSGGGGSTITQQLAKNAYLSLDQTFNRKAKELFLAIEIEKNYSKDEIMSMYLNNSYFGNGVWGIQDAAQRYFGVDAVDLTVGESATIVGMLKGPSLYNPIDNPENATARRDTVLQLMVDNETLSAEDAQQEEQVAMDSLVNDNYQQEEEGYQYPYYFDAVIEEAEERYDINADDLMNRGYKVYTALDTNFQDGMQEVYDNNGYFPSDASDGTMVQSGSVAVDPETGGIQAMVGRRGEYTFRGFNFATDMKRSPGSTIKPLSVYTPALEAGYMPDSVLKDEPQDYYEAENYSGDYSGEVPMYQAVAQSLNLPAVWLLHEMGISKGYNKTEEFGLDLTESDQYYGLALGGLEYGTSPMEMAGAYSTFANGGTLYSPHFITKIIDANGAVIVDNTNPEGEKIISNETSNEMNSMLLGTFSNGTAANANPYGYTVAGKTGTTETNYDPEQNNDQWIIGYTPDTVISTWLGFEESEKDHTFSGTSGEVVGQVFKAQAENMLPYSNNTPFEVANAYNTDGEVTTSSDAEDDSSDEGENNWQDGVDQFTDDAKQGLGEFSERIKQGGEDLIRGFKERFN